MHVLMVTLMVTNGSVIGLGPIYKSDLWIYFGDTGVPSVVFISGDPFISGFPGLVQMILWLSDHWFSSDDGGMNDMATIRLFSY